MPRSDCNQEQIWALIQARKQKRPATEAEPSTSSALDASPAADTVLIDVLYQALRSPLPEGGTSAASARLTLQSAIALDSIRAPLKRAKSGFWRVSGKRNLVLAVALLLITAAAI